MATRPRPRPILKRDSPLVEPTLIHLPFSTCGNVLSPHVHFPPTPGLSSHHPTHSPRSYDRAPIVVSPNVCQLPQRGARKLHSPPVHFEVERRGRSRSRNTPEVKGSYFHPRAYEACNPEPELDSPTPPTDLPLTPSLVQDLSPSDESDDSITTPPGSKPAAIIQAFAPPPFPQKAELEPFAAQARSTTSDFIHSSSLSSPQKVSQETKRRPGLSRSDEQKRSGRMSVTWDEGCLGGF
ncbi:hypothetical protein CERSUDRAFT_90879 [Gelatoporia subvermispora B]|uniref:Uncharacterized protein n=1 Tax=Ceriporiopsis subvermispora (strain B) TaxID=914234 RepID=M2RCU8_CERS8|nr:hypothetical protein CERSUDRAFT_90879 [Gelatoporia subvermispora B]